MEKGNEEDPVYPRSPRSLGWRGLGEVRLHLRPLLRRLEPWLQLPHGLDLVWHQRQVGIRGFNSRAEYSNDIQTEVRSNPAKVMKLRRRLGSILFTGQMRMSVPVFYNGAHYGPHLAFAPR